MTRVRFCIKMPTHSKHKKINVPFLALERKAHIGMDKYKYLYHIYEYF